MQFLVHLCHLLLLLNSPLLYVLELPIPHLDILARVLILVELRQVIELALATENPQTRLSLPGRAGFVRRAHTVIPLPVFCIYFLFHILVFCLELLNTEVILALFLFILLPSPLLLPLNLLEYAPEPLQLLLGMYFRGALFLGARCAEVFD